MGGFLAIDYGLKQTGLAYAEESGIAITKLPVLFTQKDDFHEKIFEIIKEKKPQVIIIGYPFGYEQNPLAHEIKKFFDLLQKNFPKIKFVLWDEYGTSKSAEKLFVELRGKFTKKTKNIRKKKQEIDSLSAQIILHSYLNSLSEKDRANCQF